MVVRYLVFMMGIRVATTFLGIAVVLGALTACDPAGEPPVSTVPPSAIPGGDVTPSATADPVTQPASVIVDGDSVSVVGSDGAIIIDILFTTDAMTAVAQANEAMGLAGTVTTVPASGSCFAERQKATWGGLSFTWGKDWQRAPGAEFLALVGGPESASGVTVTLPSGHSVGASEADVVAANAAAPYVDHGFGSILHYDVAGGMSGSNDYDSYGGSAWFENGKLKSFASPFQYYYDC